MPSPTERWAPWLCALGLLGLLLLSGWQWRGEPPVSSNLLELLPGSTPDAQQQLAEKRMQEPLNRELLVLIRQATAEQALAMSASIGQQWRASGLFERVQWSLDADLPALRQQLLNQRLALLPASAREQLREHPQTFIEQRIADLFDPSRSQGLVATADDLLGLAARIEHELPRSVNVRSDLNGALLAEQDGQTWAVLRARTGADAFDGELPQRVSQAVDAARQQAEQTGGELLASSGLLYSAHARAQAQAEISLMGSISIVAALGLLLLMFRRLRALLAFVPVAVGILAGLCACVALFGKIHVMTLVLGSSLIGVAIDAPLHLLSKSWALRPWQVWSALRATRFGLGLALLTNVIGYLALALTPFPALTQIAVFSASGLLAAYLTSVSLLPALLGRADIRPWPAPLRLAEHLLQRRQQLLTRVPSWALLLALLLFCAAGLSQLKRHDDLRQWAAMPADQLQQAQRVSQIVGVQPTSQFFLVRGADQAQLLQRQQQLSQRLDGLVENGQLQGYLALSQLIASQPEQQQLRSALAQLPAVSQPLLALGIDAQALNEEIQRLQQLPEVSIEQVLAGPLAEPWRNLWLGTDTSGEVTALVSLQGLHDASALSAQSQGLPGVQLVDRLSTLNQLFAATQISAAELKLGACLLIFVLLALTLGRRGAVRVLAIPLLATLASLACLGWLGEPLTLFSLFGLLLVTAIGVDYAILMFEQVGGAATSLLGTALSALTTWLSFGLLALSQTPAVSNFGLAVSLGLVFSFLLAPWARKTDGMERPS